MKKITIVGPGRVGESTAQILAKEELCRELVLLGQQKSRAQGIALDIQESAPLFKFDTQVTGGSDPVLMTGSGLVIFTAGMPRRPGMSRDDLMDGNLSVLQAVMKNIQQFAPEAILIIVTNPVDILTYQAWRHQARLPKKRVLGLSGVLDSARMASFIAMETGFSVSDIFTMVIGGHGDAMVPLSNYACINGIPISQFLDDDKIERIIDRTRSGGAEIIALKEKSSAYDSPAASIAAMVDAIVNNRRRVLPCVTILNGEYGENNIAMGVPVVLSREGVERIIELPLSLQQSKALAKSADLLRSHL